MFSQVRNVLLLIVNCGFLTLQIWFLRVVKGTDSFYGFLVFLKLRKPFPVINTYRKKLLILLLVPWLVVIIAFNAQNINLTKILNFKIRWIRTKSYVFGFVNINGKIGGFQFADLDCYGSSISYGNFLKKLSWIINLKKIC